MGNPTFGQTRWLQDAVGRYEASLLQYARGIVGPERARDVVQETFARLCAQKRTVVEGRLGAWLFTVCRNRALDVLRKDKRLTGYEPNEQPSLAPLPPDVAELRAEIGRALALLETLPPNQQEVIRLKFQHGLSYREISEATQLTVSNVGYLIHTGLKTLRGQLQRRGVK